MAKQIYKLIIIVVTTVILLILTALLVDIFKNGMNFKKSSKKSNENTNIEIDKARIRFADFSPGTDSIMRNIVKKYNETNENVEVQMVKMSYDTYNQQLNMLMASGEGPDVFALDTQWLTSYIYKNWVVDLSQYMDDTFLSRFKEWPVKFSENPIYQGKLYTIPADEVTLRLIYNKDLFKMAGLDPEKPPETLSQLKLYAKKISEAGLGRGKYGFALAAGESMTSFAQAMEVSNTYSGIYFYNFKEGRYDLNVYKPWIQSILDMKYEGSLFPGETTINENTVKAHFANGNIGMIYASSRDVELIDSLSNKNLNWEVALPVVMDSLRMDKGKIMLYASSCYVVNSTSKVTKAAIDFWTFLYSDQCVGQLYKEAGKIPTIKGITEDSQYKPNFSNLDKFLPGVLDSVYPAPPQGIEDWKRLKAYSDAISGGETIDEALNKGTQVLNNLLDIEISNNRLKIENYMNSQFDPLNPRLTEKLK
jgi:multiple sugar transport system substrate-binding protein